MKKTLVAYFSASGVTKRVAEKLAQVAGADLFEIEPEQKYTKADLNWMDKKSRSTLEMNDRSSRPAIKSRINLSEYDNIFVGYPIWWYREPSIIDTFMESYDFSGKTIIPFATSGSSGLEESPQNIQTFAPKAKVTGGKRLSARITEAELKDWVDSLKL